MSLPSKRDRIRGGLLGMLVGDALGVPYEFTRAEDLPPRHEIEMTPPTGFRRSHGSVPVGTWSDDGAQALCLLASLLERGRFDADDFARRLLRWFDEGYMAVDAKVFDVGVQTKAAFRTLQAGTPPLEAGPREERSNGNGSLMRVLPLALWHTGPDEALVRDAYAQSQITHGHARSRVSCALYCLWARAILNDAADPWASAVASMRSLVAPGSEEADALENHIRPEEPAVGRGSGYVIDTLRSARMVLAAESYEEAVRHAVSLGDDTDTTACVVGGIAGLRGGVAAIPPRWLGALRGRKLVDPLLERLLSS
jgi:ADP-ribosylglycohydrolase